MNSNVRNTENDVQNAQYIKIFFFTDVNQFYLDDCVYLYENTTVFFCVNCTK